MLSLLYALALGSDRWPITEFHSYLITAELGMEAIVIYGILFVSLFRDIANSRIFRSR